MFAVLMYKAKIVKEVKRTKYEKRDREVGQSKVKNVSSPSRFVHRPKKWARSDRSPRTEA